MPTSKPRKKRRKRNAKPSFETTRRSAAGYDSLPSLEKAIGNDPQLLAQRLQLLTDRRKQAVRQGRSMLSTVGWEELLLLPTADIALSASRAKWPRTKNMTDPTDWPTHLRWSLDQFAEIQRLVAAGLTYGALMTSRLFLERWTINSAINASLSINEGEAESAFIDRVWATYGAHVHQNMGQEWAWLSECLHGRSDYQDVLRTDLFINGDNFPDPNTMQFSARISEISKSVLFVVLVGIHNELRAAGIEDLPSPISVSPHVPSSELLGEITASELFTSQFAPLDTLTTFSKDAERLLAIGRRYRAEVNSLTADKLDTSTVPRDFLSALLERRARSIELAVQALTTESAFHDPEEGRAQLLARLFRYGAIAQGAILVAGRSPKPEAQALRTAAAALESTWKLWLDDADTSLGCCRGLLEQTARARVHRIKPAKAERMEATRNPPNRWIEEARLKRLNEFGRALGEFSHLKLTSRRFAARQKLTEFQEDTTPYPEQTARLHAMETSAYFLAKEVYARFETHYPKLSQGFLETVTLFDANGHEAFENESMNRALTLRDSDWGDPDFGFFN